MIVSDILRKAADRLEPDGAWTQRAYARTVSGIIVLPFNDNAVCWCARGAIALAARDSGEGATDACAAFSRFLEGQNTYSGDAIAVWNDHPQRTQAQVVGALRRAADWAEETCK